MNEREFAKKLTRQLNTAPLSDHAADRLRSAREAAVARAVAQQTTALASAGNLVVRFWQRHHTASIGLLLAVTLAIAGAGWQWHQSREADRSIEAMLLADDVPMDMFLSERF